MVGAEAAVIGAAELGTALKGERDVRRLQIVPALAVIGGIGRDQRLLHPMLDAALLEEDVAALDQDLGGHEIEAGLAERGGLPVEDVGLKRTHGPASRLAAPAPR